MIELDFTICVHLVKKNILRNYDSFIYISISDLNACRLLAVQLKQCSELYAYLIDSDAVCEAQVLKKFNRVSHNCKCSIIFSQDTRSQKLEVNMLLDIIFEPPRIIVNCAQTDTKWYLLHKILY